MYNFKMTLRKGEINQMAKKLKTRDKSEVVKISNLNNMIKKVHLGGAIEECILEVDKGYGSITAVDITNSMIVVINDKIMSKKVSGTFGLGNLELLTKFLSTIEDESASFKMKRNKIIIERKDSQRKLDYLLTQPDLIATRFQKEDKEEDAPYEKIAKMMTHSVELNESFTKDLLKYTGLLKTKELTLKYSDGKLSVICGTSDDYRIELKTESDVEQKKKKGSSGDFSIKVDGEYLSRIFSVIDIDEDDPPVLSLAKDKPITIEEKSEDNENVWILVPLTDVEEEEESEPDGDFEDADEDE